MRRSFGSHHEHSTREHRKPNSLVYRELHVLVIRRGRVVAIVAIQGLPIIRHAHACSQQGSGSRQDHVRSTIWSALVRHCSGRMFTPVAM